jgi:pimeloyl-ACP methyl ester carboxylesterase
MSPQSTSSKTGAFDELYAKVPTDQFTRLKEFRLTHPLRRLKAGGATWEYISCGRGEGTLLLLPGALSLAESMFPLISAFEKQFRVIAPSYALSETMTGLCDGIAQILKAENVEQTHLCGGSYGGLVAQYFVRQYPDVVRSLILSHTFVFSPKYAKRLRVAGKLFALLPEKVFVFALKLRLNKLLLNTLRAALHPELEFWRAYLNEAIASGLLREVSIHQNMCLLSCTEQPRFTPEDLREWPGKILIIESDDDPAIPARARELLRSIYPQAQVHTFHNAGHASSILKREEVITIIKSFLNNVQIMQT